MDKKQLYYATRKSAHAHALITKGSGVVRINNIPVEMVEHITARELILIPFELIGNIRQKIDVVVKVSGGGFMGQSGAAATAISRALTGWTKNKQDPTSHPLDKATRKEIKEKILAYDKYLISGDARRKEPKKFGGPGARRRKQKSYR
ncbi:MAG: 30S ribosomal protein S9 [Candidatus Nitrosoabyssus spongiisocia]|nr:MAG: 30S ribosomal protein S9 [Nitrosopumilaceae archaeon AB1(1)]